MLGYFVVQVNNYNNVTCQELTGPILQIVTTEGTGTVENKGSAHSFVAHLYIAA